MAALGKRLTLVTTRNFNFTDWAEDPYVVVASRDGTAFIEPYSFLRHADSLVAQAVAGPTRSKFLRRHSTFRVATF